jgi:hypothetical protein
MVRAVHQLAVRSVPLLLSDPEDLGRFLDELAACRRGGQRPAGSVNEGESGGRFDLVEHLHQGAGAPVVEDAGCSRNPDFAHPVLMIIRNCSLIHGSYKGTLTSTTSVEPVDEKQATSRRVAPEFVWQLNQHADRPDLCIILSGDAACEIDGLPRPTDRWRSARGGGPPGR